ncbi:MAG: hypothetical protein NTZ16_10260 [Verrucomicrobia bacterium]|nr:hypothetical protein [Verrucomicrobiota bacterium]
MSAIQKLLIGVSRPFVLTVALVLLGSNASSSADTQIQEQAKAVHARLAPALKPAVREWVSQEAKKVSRNPKLNEAAVKADIQNRFAGQTLASGDIEALVFIVMMEATKDANEDLKALMAATKAANEKKAAQRQAAGNLKKDEAGIKAAARQEAAGTASTNLQIRAHAINVKPSARASAAQPDSMGDMSEEQQLRLQMAMDRRAKVEEILSNVMKKMSDTQSNIVGNLK